MSAYLHLALALTIIIFAAKAAGYLSTRLGQPAVLGELLVGLLLGPTALDMIHWPMFSYAHLRETIAHLAELGVIFLMFMAGLEVNLGQLRRTGKVSALAGTLGVIFPVLMGLGNCNLVRAWADFRAVHRADPGRNQREHFCANINGD